MTACALAEIPVTEHAPRKVKQAVTVMDLLKRTGGKDGDAPIKPARNSRKRMPQMPWLLRSPIIINPNCLKPCALRKFSETPQGVLRAAVQWP